MKRLLKLKNPSNDHGLLWFAIAYQAIVSVGLVLLGMAIGCEEPVRLKSSPTTMPALKGPNPAEILANQREGLDTILGGYIIAQKKLAQDNVDLIRAEMRVDVLVMQAARTKDQAMLSHYIKAKRKLGEVRAELDARAFDYRAELDHLRMQAVEFDRMWPGLWLWPEGGRR